MKNDKYQTIAQIFKGEYVRGLFGGTVKFRKRFRWDSCSCTKNVLLDFDIENEKLRCIFVGHYKVTKLDPRILMDYGFNSPKCMECLKFHLSDIVKTVYNQSIKIDENIINMLGLRDIIKY